ncbi:MAG: class D sortase [Oscillospiraceae bacterium]|nr:class D sortase [Oscillospiraceae bacterium]
MKKQKFLFVIGILTMIIGISMLSVMAYRKISRDLHRQKLMNENIVIEIPEIHIKAPVLEGTENTVLSVAAGHFHNTGEVGKGNFCIAAHSSTIYKEYFNNLKNVQNGMKILLYRPDKTYAVYEVSNSLIVNPDEVWILDDFGDCRITLVTCTDDGSQRLVVIGNLKSQE